MMCSPNRFNRDWITKALVQLLRGHPDVLLAIMRRFVKVNDPYVWERVVTIAYGAAMRADPAHIKGFADVVQFVSSEIFGDLGRFVPDAVMVDSARGLVEWGVEKGLLSKEAAKMSRPPYGFRPPSRPWTKKTIDERFYGKSEERRPDNESYHAIYWSLM